MVRLGASKDDVSFPVRLPSHRRHMCMSFHRKEGVDRRSDKRARSSSWIVDRSKRRKGEAHDGKRKDREGMVEPHPKRSKPTDGNPDGMFSTSPSKREEMEVGTDTSCERWEENENQQIRIPAPLDNQHNQSTAVTPFGYLVQRDIRQHNMQVVPWTPAPILRVDQIAQRDLPPPEQTSAQRRRRPTITDDAGNRANTKQEEDGNDSSTSMEMSID